VSQFIGMPTAASAFAGKVDVLLWTMTAVTGTVAAGIFILLVVFAIRYRRAAVVNRTLSRSPATRRRQRALEYTWIAVPLAIFIGFFVWAAALYFNYESPPRGALEIYVVARQWMWKLEQPNGRREIDELHVPRGRPVKLIMTSQDVIHSFFVPGFRLKRDVVPGMFTILWFTPTVNGEYHLFCSEYCGTDHSRMGGRVVVMEPQAYAHWLASGNHEPSLATSGEAKFRAFGCSGCHSAGAAVHAPDLANLYGRTIPLANGQFVQVDERYLRDSILLPGSELAAGYPNIMPSFAGRVSEQDLLELIAYIKSMAPRADPEAGGAP
jgi:cytochrome c oxidase subunit II